ncbi:hybrid sensor histidine kinase/response regulator transcription factor [Mucilaginibacter terrae]|uniref:histidine kinase n=1 Tax=Mucilaginibacter terrae TaxID=1955052 RepID=A0ABU3GPG9_9SPHI|nr:two-component regulator propeller domain-containing protein [Mucilaginibacter terrae]MDT3401376.1 signal transduction histidine kinase/ligand-binding sensor domain-containing protein/AraC-like DNA-binding protein [Mucilaginibacter terrae]
MPKCIITCIVVLMSLGIYASDVKAQPNCKIEHYSTEDGLSHNRIMCMMKDRDGFMWFGTWDGLNRFDGHNFLAYKSRPGDTSSLKNSRIQDIVEDQSGNLWLKAYDDRIYRFNKKNEQFFLIQIRGVKAKSNTPAYDKIKLSRSGEIWLTTVNNGIHCFTNPGAKKPAYVSFGTDYDNNHKLPSCKINFLNEDNSGKFWVGTSNGVVVISKISKTKQYKAVRVILPKTASANFTAIAENNTRVWLGTSSGEIIGYEKSSGKCKLIRPSKEAVTTIIISRNSNYIYATTAKGQLIKIAADDAQNKIYEMPSAGKFFAASEDSQGLIWLCPEYHGAIKFDPNTGLFKVFDQKADTYHDPQLRYFKVFEDKSGLVWVSMRNGGFGYYNRQKDAIEYFYDKPGSPDYHFSNVIVSSYIDPSGILWLNAEDKGLSKIVFLHNDFTRKLLVENSTLRSDNEIRGIGYDNRKRLWLANKSWQIYVNQDGILSKIKFTNSPPEGIGAVYSIIQDATGSMWLGTKNNGLFKAEAVDEAATTFKLTHYKHDAADKFSISGNSVYSLLKDSKGRIWAGTYDNGLNLVQTEGNKIKFLNARNVFADLPEESFRRVRYVQQDAAGRIWVATTDGLLVVKMLGKGYNHQLITYSKIPGDITSLGKNDIQFIYRDSKNNMWLATSGGGLNKVIGNDPFKKLTFRSYTTEDGLNSDYILSCVEDNEHKLWLATENGLSRFDPKTGQVQNYDSSDGLPKAGFSEAASLKLSSGHLIFGGLNGYVSFNPAEIVEHKVKANMVLTNLQVNNADIVTNDKSRILKQNINQVPELKLKWNQNTISIDYSVLDFRLNKKQSYAYRLVGFDNEWRSNKSQRRATYTDLRPGTYKFEVTSSNLGAYSNRPYKSLIIKIAQPPWLSWWAFIIYIILAAVIIETVRRTLVTLIKLRHRIALEKHLAELKTNFFTNVSHELRTPLTLILNPIEELKSDESLSHRGRAHVEMVSRNAQRMERFINQLLDLRKAESGKAVLNIANVELVKLLTDIAGYFTEAARDKNIQLLFNLPKHPAMVWLDVEKFDIIIYNILANAIKFTPLNKVISLSLQINEAQSTYQIEIADQGVGVLEKDLENIFKLYYTTANSVGGTGIGLAFAKELVELHSGKISACNNTEGGLTVSLTIPLGSSYLTGRKITYADNPEIPKNFEEGINELLLHHNVQQANTSANLPLLLIVEDNPDLRSFLQLQLSDIYRILLADNGVQGFNKATELLPDIILSDVMMPEMNGIQMLDKLKNNAVTSHIPVILLTARFAVEHQIEGLQYGADYYITKPFHKNLLLSAIQNVLEQRKRIFEKLSLGKNVVLEPAQIQITSGDEIFLKKVIDVVDEQMANIDFNIDDMAGLLNLGRSTFNKKIKALTNLTPVELVREMRLKRGKQYLNGGEHTISEIAYLIGFGSSKYFSTCFKEQFGLSPSDYQRNNIKSR